MSDWKSLKSVDIVYADNDTVEFKGVKYPKAYIVESGNKRSLESAIRWATRWSNSAADPKIVTTQNDGFTMQIVEAAGGSSQGGRLSFWMCLFEKDDVPAFATGINTDLLNILILQTTLVNGAVQGEKVFFARNNGQLGVLHSGMPEYEAFCEDVQTREQNAKAKKTTNWKVGYVYTTTREKSVMLGKVRHLFYLDETCDTWVLDFQAKTSVFYGDLYGELSMRDGKLFDDVELSDAVCYAYCHIGREKCPARVESVKLFDDNAEYRQRLRDAVVANVMKRTTSESRDPLYALRYALTMCGQDKKLLFEMLYQIEKAAKDYVATSRRLYDHKRLRCDGKVLDFTNKFDLSFDVIRRTRDYYAEHDIE